jgi:predicted MFS family arabinose efflux permease
VTATSADRRFLGGISITLGLRQLALLMVLPFLSLYVQELPGGTPALAGVVIGINGLAQGVLQMPFGAWSDSVGRKRIVLLGMALLVVGLLVAAWARDVAWLIVGRALQGSGAVNGAAYAWIADRTPGDRLSRAMGTAAAAVGVAAVVSFVAGPLLYTVLSLPQIFLLCAVLAALVTVYVAVAMDEGRAREARARGVTPPDVWRSAALWRLVGAGFLANYILMAVAFAMPLLLAGSLGRHLWKVLIPAALVGVLAMRAATAAADRGRFTSMVWLASLAFLPTGVCLLAGDVLAVALGTALFMAGYLSLSALLPAGISRVAGPAARGSVSGAYSTAAFLGSFAGGVVTGALWGVRPRLALGAVLVAWALGQVLVTRLSPRLLSVVCRWPGPWRT